MRKENYIMATAIQITREFKRRLKRRIGARRYREVLRLNAGETMERTPGGRPDHAHDFIDANVLWDGAFKKVTGKRFEFTDADFKKLNSAIRAWKRSPRRRR